MSSAPDSAYKPTIGSIFREYGPGYLAKYSSKMSVDQIKALKAISRCRTASLGVTVYRCKSCEKLHYIHRPCGNRHCPQCQYNKAKRWKEKQLQQLLPAPYFMLTFTVPKEIRRFIRSNPKECYRALMKASADTLTKLAKDPKYIGSSRLGMTSVLHTWGRDLNYHPHVHILVPGGAIGNDQISWLPSRVDYLVNVVAASVIFRAKFRSLMAEAGLLSSSPASAWRKTWNVNCKSVGDGRKAVQYLAPYIFKVAIGDRRIVKVSEGPDGQGEVIFMVRRSGTKKYKPMRVSAEEFIRRYLQHVLPKGFQKVRHTGFAHPRARTDWEWLQMLVTTTLDMVYVLHVMGRAPVPPEPMSCDQCGGELSCIGVITGDQLLRMALNTS